MSLWVVTIVCRGEERRATRNKREAERNEKRTAVEEGQGEEEEEKEKGEMEKVSQQGG